MDEFRAEIAEIHALARAFSEHGEALRAAIPGFATAAYSVNDALGRLTGLDLPGLDPLGPSKGVLADYLETAQEQVETLGKLAARLELDDARLRLIADNYKRADAAGKESFGEG